MKSDEERSWSANRGYDDAAGIYYSYDSNVPNSKRVAIGDVVVVRVDDWVAGWGVIEYIEVTPNSTKEVRRCPKCRKTNHRPRVRPFPSNICDACGRVFPDEEMITTFESVTIRIQSVTPAPSLALTKILLSCHFYGTPRVPVGNLKL